MMCVAKIIQWRKSTLYKSDDIALNGVIDVPLSPPVKKIIFKIEQKGVRNPKFVLQSYPLDTGIFTRANNSKKLGEYPTVEKAQEEAQKFLEKYISFFVEKTS